MRFILRIWAIFVVAIRRLFAQRGLALATALGLVVSVAIVMSIPLYTDAVYYKILQDELTETDSDSGLRRPPFAFMFRYVGALYGPKDIEEIEQASTYLMGQGTETLSLPHKETVRYLRTDNFRLFPTADLAYVDVKDPLEWISFSSASDLENKITLLEGTFPAAADSNPESPMPVLISETIADELGLQVGENYVAFRKNETESGVQNRQILVQVSGVWRANDPSEDYWFYKQSVFETQFFIPEASMQLRIAPLLEQELAQALWYIILDGSGVNSDDVGRLVSRINQVQQQTSTLLANTRLEVSPLDALQNYQRSSRLLNVLLYAFSIPIVGLLLAFIGLVVGLSVARQRNEIAVLRSRGATATQVFGIALLESLILGGIALALGIPFGRLIATVIGATRSFLNFTVTPDLRIEMTSTALQFGIGAIVVTLIAQVLPSIGASRHTIITYKQEQARMTRAPWWQRAWLDILLLLPAGYGAYILSQQGSILTANSDGTTNLSGGPFENPLLFLVPALGALSLTLVVLRILPWLMRILAWVASKTNSVSFLLASQYLARAPGSYTAPLILLILTLSLSTFTASLAQTLDHQLYDQVHYRNGGTGRLVELGEAPDSGAAVPGGGGGAATEGDDDIAESRWVFVPVSEHLEVPEIEAATRIGDFSGRVQIQGKWQTTKFVGIDRIDFPKVAFWRYDFAPATLGALMNSLALAPEAILLPGDFMRQNKIRVGDQLQIRVESYGERAEMTMKVMGELTSFPQWYPDEDPLIVGNLDYLFEQMGGPRPYDVWVKTAPGTDYDAMSMALRKLDLFVLSWRSSELNISEQQQLPERQGLFGVLSVGFLAAAFLTVLGFFLYALFSFRRRFIELGTLRAIGLSPFQMTGFLTWELLFLILLGLGAGTGLGIIISQVFIPYLQIGTDIKSLTPPFLVEIAWPAIIRIYILFGLLFVVALSVLAALLLRMKIFQAIKLGETV